MRKITALYFFFFIGKTAFGQLPPAPYGPLPSPAQLAWQEMEMYCLIHFGVDTYTDKEWGYGDEDPALVNPVRFNAAQIVAAAKAGGFKGVVVVAKHHDGLCLWPTKTTEHNISKSPWQSGKGDMVAAYRKACDDLGMQLGIYCSPWDRNSALYGSHDYVQLYRAQLKELYANYGRLFISWHDGANGGDGYYGGAREVRKIDRTSYYGWDTTLALTRKMQPTAVIFGDIGPDVRWVGNEEGYAGETSWATYLPKAPDEGKAPSNGYVKYWEATQGHREAPYWMPAECDVPLRAGWFYHKSQDGTEKSPYTLLDLYYKSVGRGAGLDLGISPDKDGLLSDGDVASLKGFGGLLRQTFAKNLAGGAKFTASNIRGNNAVKFGPRFLTDTDRYSYWATDDGITNPGLTIDLPAPRTFNIIRLRENIQLGQRIDSLVIEALQAGKWKELTTTTSIGANRLIRLPQDVTATRLRVRIIKAAACIALSDFGLFKEPARIASPVIRRNKAGLVSIDGAAGSVIHYTVDGTMPSPQSPVYKGPFLLPAGGMVKAKGFTKAGLSTEQTVKHLDLSKSGWKIMVPADSKAAAAIDEEGQTFFRAGLNGSKEISIDMGQLQTIKTFSYLPAPDKNADGLVDKYAYSISVDGTHWKQVATGEFANIKASPIEQVTRLEKPVTARYFKITALQVIAGNGISVAELGVQ